jgi:hypothetical protein
VSATNATHLRAKCTTTRSLGAPVGDGNSTGPNTTPRLALVIFVRCAAAATRCSRPINCIMAARHACVVRPPAITATAHSPIRRGCEIDRRHATVSLIAVGLRIDRRCSRFLRGETLVPAGADVPDIDSDGAVLVAFVLAVIAVVEVVAVLLLDVVVPVATAAAALARGDIGVTVGTATAARAGPAVRPRGGAGGGTASGAALLTTDADVVCASAVAVALAGASAPALAGALAAASPRGLSSSVSETSRLVRRSYSSSSSLDSSASSLLNVSDTSAYESSSASPPSGPMRRAIAATADTYADVDNALVAVPAVVVVVVVVRAVADLCCASLAVNACISAGCGARTCHTRTSKQQQHTITRTCTVAGMSGVGSSRNQSLMRFAARCGPALSSRNRIRSPTMPPMRQLVTELRLRMLYQDSVSPWQQRAAMPRRWHGTRPP